MSRTKTILLFLAVIVLAVVLWPFQDIFETSRDVRASRFCAYGHVYVEFQQGNKIWGTTFLNKHGKPVSCDEPDSSERSVLQKEII